MCRAEEIKKSHTVYESRRLSSEIALSQNLFHLSDNKGIKTKQMRNEITLQGNGKQEHSKQQDSSG